MYIKIFIIIASIIVSILFFFAFVNFKDVTTCPLPKEIKICKCVNNNSYCECFKNNLLLNNLSNIYIENATRNYNPS